LARTNQAGQFDEQFVALFELSSKDRPTRVFNELLDCAAAAKLFVFLDEPLIFVVNDAIFITTVTSSEQANQ